MRSIVAASEPSSLSSSLADFDPNLAALIALLIILFLGIIMFSIICCCLRNWVFAKAAARSWNKPQKLRESSPKLEDGMRTMSIIGANGIYNAPTSVVDDGPAGTDNPLWIDQKYKGTIEIKPSLR